MCFWVVPYFVGLHFTYFDKLKLSGFNIVPSKMRRWPLKNWLIFGIVCFLLLWEVIGLAYFYIKAKVLGYYCAAAFLIVAAVAIPAWLLKTTHELHIHHYNIGMAFVVLIGYQSAVLAPLSGLFNGLMIEGVSAYAYDPVFERRRIV